MSQEIELKLAIPLEFARRLAKLGPILQRQHGASSQRHYRAVYFDTPSDELAASKTALRVRREAHGWIQTLKQSGAADLGLSARVELNWEVPRLGLNLGYLDNAPISKHRAWNQIRGKLKRRFTTQFNRTTWVLHWPDGSIAELALDEGEILAGPASGQRTTPLLELEIELKAGHAQRLWEFAFELADHGPLVPLIASKAQRGYELLGAPPEPLKSKPTADPQQTQYSLLLAHGLGQALRVLHHNLRHAHIENPEFIHQARVALRRVRSLLRGAQALDWHEPQRKALEKLKQPLRCLGQRLGEVRDADVLHFDTLPRLVEVLSMQASDRWQDLQQQAEAARPGAYDTLSQMWLDRQYGHALLLLEHFVWSLHQAPQQFVPKHGGGVQMLALTQLAAQHEAMWRASRDLSRLDVIALHELRIQAKRMRYLLDFWLTLWKKSELRSYRSGVVALVDSLGTISDDAHAILALSALQADPELIETISAQATKQRHRRLPAIAAALVELDLADMPWRRR